MGLEGSAQREDKRVPLRASKKRCEISLLGNSRSRTRTADWLKRDFAAAGESWAAKDCDPRLPEKTEAIASAAITIPAAILTGTIRMCPSAKPYHSRRERKLFAKKGRPAPR